MNSQENALLDGDVRRIFAETPLTLKRFLNFAFGEQKV